MLNKYIKTEIITELNEANKENWDLYKIRIQSIFRAYKQPHTPETQIDKLNQRINSISTKLVANPHLNDLHFVKTQLSVQLQQELEFLAEKWQIRSKTRWIESGKKSTKYFFYFIQKTYKEIYQKEDYNINAADILTANLKQVTPNQNMTLTKQITEEEVLKVIQHLPNHKSPGADGLTYEFYKDTAEIITLILAKIFNKVLNSGELPSSWCKNLIILIPKK